MSIAKVYASTLCMDNLDKDKFYTECANNNSLKKKTTQSQSREIGMWDMGCQTQYTLSA